MTDQRGALQAVSAARRRFPSITLAGIAALSVIGLAAAQAKQSCSAAAGSQGYWSWRMIDGRKCWYEGKPMLSKSLLEWRAERAAAQSAPAPDREIASTRPAMRHDPMDAQARAPDDSTTFEALWRSRIER